MDKLADYVQWIGEFPIAATGFRDADALVLCALSYFDLSPVLPSETAECRVSDCKSMIAGNQVKVMITGGDKGYPELLALCCASKRFGQLKMNHYVDVFREDPPLQFSAVCFHDDRDFSFVAYRGTDDSLAGWKEDFMISFTKTEAQELALAYAKKNIVPGRSWYMGGQSKGSNLALYAACLMEDEKWKMVKRLYLLDGPGFCPDVMDLSLINRINTKTVQVVPRFCVVGKLFAPQITDTRIIQSSAPGFLQHAMITWGIDHGRLAMAGEHDPDSVILNKAVDEWIRSIEPSDRVVLVNELFDALAAGGAETLEQLQKGGKEGLEAIFRRLSDFSETTKRSLSELPLITMKTQLESLKKWIDSSLEDLKKNKL